MRLWWGAVVLSLMSAAPARAEVTIVDVVPRSAAANADLRIGDVLEAWRRPGDQAWAVVESPFDLNLIEVERASTAPFLLRFRRNTTLTDVEIGPGVLGIAAVPGLDANAPGRSRSFLALSVSDQLSALAAAAERSQGVEASWYWSEYAEIAIWDKRFEEGLRAHNAALEALPESTHQLSALSSWIRLKTGKAHWRAGDYDNADRIIEANPTPSEKATQLSKLLYARGKYLCGRHASYRAEYDLSRSLLEEARDIQNAVVPFSISLALTFHELGNMAFWRGDTDTAERSFRKALEIRETLAPESDQHARSLASMGNVFWRRGEVEKAELYFQRVHDIHEVTQPNSLVLAGDKTMLGHVANDRNDFAAAENYYYQSLAISQKVAPGEETVANTLMAIASVSRRRFDLDRARELHRVALDIYTSAGSKQRRALSLSNLGNVELDAGNLAQAQKYYEESLAIRKEIGISSGYLMGSIFYNIGRLEHRKGRPDEARKWLEKALAEFVGESPDSLRVQAAQFQLGEVALSEDAVTDAAAHYEKSLEIARRLAPGTMNEVESLHRTAVVASKLGDAALARQRFDAAVAAFELQRRRVGGVSATQRHFAGQFEHVYEGLAALQIAAGEHEEAFDTIERFRSRVLSAMISGRLGDVRPRIDGSLDEDLARARKEYDVALAQLMSSSGADETELAERRERLDRARRDRKFLEARYAALMPRRASIEIPEPAPLREAAGRFTDDVAILSYVMTPDAAYVFAVAAGEGFELEFVRLDVDPLSLGGSIDGFLDLMQLTELNDVLRDSLLSQSQALYGSLIQPVAHVLAGKKKLIVLPDGALYRLPFAALSRASGETAAPEFLVQDHEILYAPSLHWLLTSIASSAPVTDESDVLVFADPEPHGEEVWPENLSGLYRGVRLPPLPAARWEAEVIAKLFDDATVHVGRDASESKFKEAVASKQFEIQHFATHAVSSSARPMESFLVLRPEVAGSNENGLLQAREIAEGPPIVSDLVVLSACHTAPDADNLSGSVSGLTGAFLYAGARNVIATYWPVRDQPTSRFMQNLYERLRNGLSPAAALREAQRDAIREAYSAATDRSEGKRDSTSNPLAWAAFALYGDGYMSIAD